MPRFMNAHTKCKWPVEYRDFFEALVARGCGPTGYDGHWKSRCPAHEDKIASLSITTGRKGLMIRCHAPVHCSWRKILKSLALPEDVLFADYHTKSKKEPKMGTVAATYDYRDEQGVLLFQTLRFDPKDFRQRRPNPAFDPALPVSRDNAEWVYNMEGVRRVLYKLPEIKAALAEKPNRAVLYCEGEKDCDLAWSAGLLATTNPMGAGKWRDEYADMLAGATVIVIPDEDAVNPDLGYSPGVKHAEDVANGLLGKAKSVKLVRLPGVPLKGDLTDWWHLEKKSLEDRKKDFVELVIKTPAWVRTGTPQSGSKPATQPSLPMGQEKESPKKPAPVKTPTPTKTSDPTPAVGDDLLSKIKANANVQSALEMFQSTAASMLLLNWRTRSPAEWYGLLRMGMNQLDELMTPTDHSPELDHNKLRATSAFIGATLLLGAYESTVLPGLDK